MKVINQYPSYHYIEEYKLTDYFCPNCGSKNVWEEDSEGDFYVGPSLVCTKCRCQFTMQGPYDKNPHDDKIIDQLISGVTAKVVTPIGN